MTTQQMVINQPCLTHINDWLVQDQMVLGKDLSNPLIAGNLLKITWNQFSMTPSVEELASPDLTTSGKDHLKLFIVDNLLKIGWLSTHHIFLFVKSWLVQSKRLW